jgi:hypothetical protein
MARYERGGCSSISKLSLWKAWQSTAVFIIRGKLKLLSLLAVSGAAHFVTSLPVFSLAIFSTVKH